MLNPAWFELGLLLTAGAAALEDLASRRIPNPLLSAAFASACVLHVAAGTFEVLLAGTAVGALVLLPLYLLNGMGAGDIKLMMVLGAFGGPQFAVAGGLCGLIVFGLCALLALRAGFSIRAQRWPFAPALAAGSLFALAQISSGSF